MERSTSSAGVRSGSAAGRRITKVDSICPPTCQTRIAPGAQPCSASRRPQRHTADTSGTTRSRSAISRSNPIGYQNAADKPLRHTARGSTTRRSSRTARYLSIRSRCKRNSAAWGSLTRIPRSSQALTNVGKPAFSPRAARARKNGRASARSRVNVAAISSIGTSRMLGVPADSSATELTPHVHVSVCVIVCSAIRRAQPPCRLFPDQRGSISVRCGHRSALKRPLEGEQIVQNRQFLRPWR